MMTRNEDRWAFFALLWGMVATAQLLWHLWQFCNALDAAGYADGDCDFEFGWWNQ